MSSDHNHSTNDPEQSHAGANHERLPPARHRTRAAPPPAPEPSAAEPSSDTASYAIGYGKPPRHSQFKPGQSGNPRGRPKAAKGLKTIVRETMTAKVPVRTAAGERKMSRMEAVMHKTIELAMKGNPRALAQLIALYGAAVPDASTQDSAAIPEDLSATDMKILAELRTSILAEAGERP